MAVGLISRAVQKKKRKKRKRKKRKKKVMKKRVYQFQLNNNGQVDMVRRFDL